MEAPAIALRLFLLAAQISDECKFEDLTYEFYVQAFSVYEESISESRAQLQAIALIIKTLNNAKVFGPDNYDTLVTQAARHGSRLLKKPHQATAVHLASHLWWQSATDADPARDVSSKEKDVDGAERPKAVRVIIGSWATLLMEYHSYSILIGTANAFWNACRSPYGLPTHQLRRLSPYNSIVMHSINIYIIWIIMHLRYATSTPSSTNSLSLSMVR